MEMENQSTQVGIEAPPKRRGRGRKSKSEAPPLAEPLALRIGEQFPAGAVDLITRQEMVLARRLAEEAGRVPDGRIDLVRRICGWCALPLEWRRPLTEAELTGELGITPMQFAVVRSMYSEWIEAMRREIRAQAAEEAQLATIDAVRGVSLAAANGSAPAFDRHMRVAWGEDVAPAGGANVQTNVVVTTASDVRALLMEKLGC